MGLHEMWARDLICIPGVGVMTFSVWRNISFVRRLWSLVLAPPTMLYDFHHGMIYVWLRFQNANLFSVSSIHRIWLHARM